MRYYALFSYLTPAIIVAVSAGGWPSGYGSHNASVCWLSTDHNALIYAFTGPVATVVFINIIFFIRTIIVVIRMAVRRKSLEEKESFQKTKRALVASGSFFSVMGIGWVFGLLNLKNDVLAFQYLFGIFGGMQGMHVNISIMIST